MLTTYGTLRASLARATPCARCPGTSWSPTRPSTSRTPAPPRPGRCARSRAAARVALTGTPVENDLTELWAILDWATPGLLGSRNAFRKVWAGPIESGLEPTQGAPVRRADRPVPAAPPQVRPRRRPGAAAQDGDRPRPGSDPRAGGALRGVRARHDGAHRARRRGPAARAGAGPAHRPQADLQPPGAVPQAGLARDSRAARRSWTPSTSWSAPSSPRTARCSSSRSTSPWPACSRPT